ncbi:PBSX family phage terminase large subunit [Auritidibacter ignavus]|uniref:PBSX family phage terminase large subunit n=1 Tax=Auritidibacter ignavus TaxID=678932 RepID=UPI000F01432F|nr:PBSX family phage terminase large subunit [Auritidibacter ignavus]NIH70497.1 PBSX family phage terminase large subunit [Auritidibacter ignavus]RMX23314.1 PBSX family phage terminase large subunit [Auritidibacter ignavus]WGH91441.1 PBSX family phage terminase large subunit [Auritidibacter ignavus]
MPTLDGLLSPKQHQYLTGSHHRVNLTTGAIRSGKTLVTLIRWVTFIIRAPRGGELIMVGRTRDSVWRNCVSVLQDPNLFGPIATQVKGNYGAPTINALGRTIHIIGASDAKAEKTIRGLTVSGAYVDELTTIDEQFFTQLLGRMSVPGAKLFASTNPEGPAHWAKTKFIDRIGGDLKDWGHWAFTIDDNPSLEETYKNSIKKEFTGVWYERFIEGKWVAGEGAIFNMWDPQHHIIRWDELPPMAELLAVGVDYGTSNATAAISLGIGLDGDLYALHEWSHSGRDTRQPLTDAQLANHLETWLAIPHAPDDPRTPRHIILDPSAASFHTELATRGTHATPADNNVLYGIRTLASLLSQGRLHVADTCKTLIEEMPGYAWDPKATENGEDKPIKRADHAIDALRYAVVTTEQHWKPIHVRQTKQRPGEGEQHAIA